MLNNADVELVTVSAHSVLWTTSDRRLFGTGLQRGGILGTSATDASTAPVHIDALDGMLIEHLSAGGFHALAHVSQPNRAIYVWGSSE